MTMGGDQWFRQTIQQLQAEFDQKLNTMAGGLRRMQAEQGARNAKALSDLATIARGLEISRSGAGIVRIEDIPGKRIPYDYLVDIPIGNGVTSRQEQSITITQEGPFVATARYATFQSALEFQVTMADASTPRFSGRSFGRYRPIHSAWDLNDGSNGVTSTFAQPLPANIPAAIGQVGGVELTSATSGFRTMEFDGRVTVIDTGGGLPRQNIAVPTSMWTPQINSPQDLAALDFFERGSVVTFQVQPNHVNNPPAGNAKGLEIFGTAGWPFLAGQYDKHEGIVTPLAFSTTGATPPVVTRIPTTDTVLRLPDGILTIGYLGYRVLQPLGPVG